MKQPESKEVNRKQKRHLSWPKEKKKKRVAPLAGNVTLIVFWDMNGATITDFVYKQRHV